MKNTRLIIRPATVSDTAAILDVYRNFVLNSTVTFEEEVPTLEQFRARIGEITAEHPFLVCEDGGHVAGYAYAHRHQSRAAYRYSAELSVYLRPHYTGLGIGRAMCDAVVELLRMQGVQTVYSAISLPNEPSCALHKAMGFTPAGVWKNTGYKKGRWIDIEWYELAIGDYPKQPSGLTAWSMLEPSSIASVLARANEKIAAPAAQE